MTTRRTPGVESTTFRDKRGVRIVRDPTPSATAREPSRRYVPTQPTVSHMTMNATPSGRSDQRAMSVLMASNPA